jgi:hypothetical protein
MENRACVLTGDIIASSRSEPGVLDHALKTLSDAADHFEHGSSEDRPPRFTRYRGDGWQMVISDPRRALRGALFLRARLRASGPGLETRISIGIGRVETLGTDNLSDATGAAFLVSGRALDRMGRSHTMAIDGEGVTPLHRAIVILAAERSRRWSREQAEAIALALDGTTATQADIAEILSISTQAVNLRLTGGGYQALREAVEIWEDPGHLQGRGDGPDA